MAEHPPYDDSDNYVEIAPGEPVNPDPPGEVVLLPTAADPPSPDHPSFWSRVLSGFVSPETLAAAGAVASFIALAVAVYALLQPQPLGHPLVVLITVLALCVLVLLIFVGLFFALQDTRDALRRYADQHRRQIEQAAEELRRQTQANAEQRRRHHALIERVRLISQAALQALTPERLQQLIGPSADEHKRAAAVTGIFQEVIDALQRAFADFVTPAKITVGLLFPRAPRRGARMPTHLAVTLRSHEHHCAPLIHADDIPIADSVSGRVFTANRSVLLRDTNGPLKSIDIRVKRFGDSRSVIWTPVVPLEYPEFVLSVACSVPRSLKPQHIDLVRATADLLAIVYNLTDFKGTFQRAFPPDHAANA